jgi:uncharacterized repeat protein (TIGR01451 family)
MIRSVKAVVPAAILLGAFAGCSSEPTTIPHEGTTGSSAAPNPREPAAPQAQQQTAHQDKASGSSSDGKQHASLMIPTGRRETSVLLVERDLPYQIANGQEFSYNITVTNISDTVAKYVTVQDECARPMTLVSADPKTTSNKQPLEWALGDLNPGQARTIHVVGKTTGSEPFSSCASATYNSTLCLSAPIVNPALRVTLSAPAEATPCDTIPVRMSVTNSGTGTARDLQLAYPLPQGWKAADGKTTAQFTVDALEPNQTREFTVNATPSKTGEFTYRASVTGASGLKAESSNAVTVIKQAVLAVKAEGPEHAYAGSPVTIKYTVTNEGNGTANGATLDSPLPAGVKFLSATDAGAWQSGVVSWKLEPIAPKASKTVSMMVEPGTIGGFETSATAKAACAAASANVNAPINISVSGIAALTWTLTDLVDPVAVGGETTYQIVVTNQGSIDATNVKLVATLESNQQFLSATGMNATLKGDKIVVDTIPKIAPKASVTVKINVKCTAEGDTRFSVSMTSDQLTRPAEKDEPTHVYK